MREACVFMMARKRPRACASSRAVPCSVSMKPESAASGVRSSWLALATKSARISSTRCSGVRSWNTSRIVATRQRVAERADMRHEPAVDRHALGELDAARAAAGRDLAHRLDHLRGAQRERGGRAARERRRDDARQRVERHDPPVAIQHDRGVRQARDDGVEQLRAARRAVARAHRVGRVAAGCEQPAKHQSAETHDPHDPDTGYFPGASPSHNSRTPRIRSDSANGIT